MLCYVSGPKPDFRSGYGTSNFPLALHSLGGDIKAHTIFHATFPRWRMIQLHSPGGDSIDAMSDRCGTLTMAPVRFMHWRPERSRAADERRSATAHENAVAVYAKRLIGRFCDAIQEPASSTSGSSSRPNV